MLNTKIEMNALFQCGAHYGHKTRFRNPKMEKYIYGIRDELSIIDLDQTKTLFEAALQCVQRVVSSHGFIVFVGTKKTAQDIIRAAAISCGMPYVDRRWLGGMLTNFSTIRALVKRYMDLCQDKENGKFDGLTKKEQLSRKREIEKLEISIGGIKNMKSLPDAIYVVDVKEEAIAVREANKLGIPVIALVDTNSSPDGVEYIIPANDDAMSSIHYFSQTIADLINEISAARQSEKASQAPKTVISRVKKRTDQEPAAVAQVAVESAEAPVEENKEAAKKSAKVHTKKTKPAEEPTPVEAAPVAPVEVVEVKKKVTRKKASVETAEKS
jgi:small subunit ribosomal protein S2